MTPGDGKKVWMSGKEWSKDMDCYEIQSSIHLSQTYLPAFIFTLFLPHLQPLK